jgi:D-lyxose ketol-isomerase
MQIKHAEYIPKGWGGEEVVCNTSTYCGKILTIYPGKTCSVHSHVKLEHFRVVSGSLNLKIWHVLKKEEKTTPEVRYSDDKKSRLKVVERLVLHPGDIYKIAKNVPHSFSAASNQPCVFIEFSEPHIESEVIRYIKGD